MGPKPGQETVLITGCSPGGIGHALCLELHKRGLHVIATARKVGVLDELAALGMSTLPLDVTSAESIKACHESVKEITGGRLDFLVNNAGARYTVPALDINLDEVRATFETNVYGVMAMVATFSDQLIAAQGLIVNVGSNSSVTPYVFASTYCATKGALASYSRTLRPELRPFGVRVMVVMAGTVRTTTPNRQTWELPEGSLYKPIEDVYKWRMGFSQTANVDTVEFAERLAGNMLAAETPWFLSFLNRWIGRRDWYWDGGMALSAWFGVTFGGEWLIDAVCYRMFKMPKLEKIVQAQRLEGKKTI